MTLTTSAPASQPTWNTGGANRTTPTGPKQALGWANGEAPSSAFFNWWMNLTLQWTTYLNTSINDLESSKINKTGASDLSGNFIPTTTNTVVLGTLAKSLKSIDTQQLSVNSDGVMSNLNPFLSGSGTLGNASKRWLSANIATIVATTLSADTINATGEMVGDVVKPIGAGNGAVGQNALPYGLLAGHVLRCRTAALYGRTAPSSSADLANQRAGSSVLASCVQTNIGGGVTIASGAYNIGTATRTAPGRYSVPLAFAPASLSTASVMITSQTLGVFASCSVSGTTVSVQCMTHAGVDSDAAWSLLVVGDHGAADVLLG